MGFHHVTGEAASEYVLFLKKLNSERRAEDDDVDQFSEC